MSNRFVIMIFGLVIGYAAVFAGERMSPGIFGSYMQPGYASTLIPGIIFLLGAAAAVLFIVAYASDSDQMETEGVAILAATALMLLSFIFGMYASPFENYGSEPWRWWDAWSVVLLVGLVPTALVLLMLVQEFSRRADAAWNQARKTLKRS